MENGDWGHMYRYHHMTNFRANRLTAAEDDPLLAEKLNSFYARFDEGRTEMTNDPMSLNVGGCMSTLQRYPDSMLGAMFRGDFPTTRDSQGNYFIDRDGPLFRHVLNFLRTSGLTLPYDFKETDLLRKEADFYQIEPLIQCLGDTKPLYPLDTFEEVVELSSTRKLSKYSNPFCRLARKVED